MNVNVGDISGVKTELTIGMMTMHWVILNQFGIDPKDLPKYISLAQRRFYLRPRQVFKMLSGVNHSIAKGYLSGFTALAAKEIFLLKRKIFKHKYQTT